jgi:hypothetical protein
VRTSCRLGLSIAVPEQKPAKLPTLRKTRPTAVKGGWVVLGTLAKLAPAISPAGAAGPLGPLMIRSRGRALRIRAGVQ